MQEGRAYWENRVLRECPNGAKCWHAIVPTTLCAETPTRKEIANSLGDHPEGTVTAPAASRYAMLACALCETSVEGAKMTVYALRVAIGIANLNTMLIKLFPARICMQCVTKPASGPGETVIQFVPADALMQKAVNTRFEKIIKGMLWLGDELPSGYMVWQLLLNAFRAEQQDLFREMELTEEGRKFFCNRHIIPLPNTYPGAICKTHILRDDWFV